MSLQLDKTLEEDIYQVKEFLSVSRKELLSTRSSNAKWLLKLFDDSIEAEMVRISKVPKEMKGMKVNVTLLKILVAKAAQDMVIHDVKVLEEIEHGFNIEGIINESGYWPLLDHKSKEDHAKKYPNAKKKRRIVNPSDVWNPSGYFEEEDLQVVHDKVKSQLEQGLYEVIPYDEIVNKQAIAELFPVVQPDKVRVVANATQANEFSKLMERSHLPGIPRLLNKIRLIQLDMDNINDNPEIVQQFNSHLIDAQVCSLTGKSAGSEKLVTHYNPNNFRKGDPRIVIRLMDDISFVVIDQLNAYGQFFLNPSQQAVMKLFNPKNQEVIYLRSMSLVMGYKGSVAQFQRITNLLLTLSNWLFRTISQGYLDDHVFIEESETAFHMEMAHKTLMALLNIDISEKKTIVLQKSCSILGIGFRCLSGRGIGLFVPDEKLRKLSEGIRSLKESFSFKKIEKLMGLIIYCRYAVDEKESPIFSAIYTFWIDQNKRSLMANPKIQKALVDTMSMLVQNIKESLPIYMVPSKDLSIKRQEFFITSDATLKRIGATVDSIDCNGIPTFKRSYSKLISSFRKGPLDPNPNWIIHETESIAVLYTILKYQDILKGSIITWKIDNTRALYGFKGFRFKSLKNQDIILFLAILDRTKRILKEFDIILKISYIKSKDNPADILTRPERFDELYSQGICKIDIDNKVVHLKSLINWAHYKQIYEKSTMFDYFL